MVRVVDMAPHPSVVKEVVCRNCGVTLEYTPRDVKTRTERDYGGGSDVIKSIDCPCCSHRIIVSIY